MKMPLPCGALALAAAFAVPAHATSVALAADGQWNEFTVDSFTAQSFGTEWIDFADGSPLTFTFTIGAGRTGTLSVLDAGFAGDTFTVTNFGASLGTTASVAQGSIGGDAKGLDDAWGDASFSRGVFTLGAGTYSVSGTLLQSVLDDGGFDLDSTNGAVRLSVVPESSPLAMLLAGAGLVGFIARRRPSRAAA
jgi:hypothetical protein